MQLIATVLMALPLDVASLTARFLGPSSMQKKLFEEGFWIFKKEILSVKTQLSIKAPV